MPPQHYHKGKWKAILKTNKQMIPLFFLQTSWALWIRYRVCVSLLCVPLVSATVISYSDHKQENKAAITVAHDETCLWGIDQTCERHLKNLQEIKDSPVVFVYTVHLPIKMQMSGCLQPRLSKQVKERQKQINKRINLVWDQSKLRILPNPVVATQEECV